MLCKKPFRQGVAEYGCGQCLPCRINRRNMWTTRLLLEARVSDGSWFVTLTYAEEHLPANASLDPPELRNFLKRLRERLKPRKVRFYAIGEYGGRFNRPHYHVCLFGTGDLAHATPADVKLLHLPACQCPVCLAWPYGGVDIREIAQETAAYITQYHTEVKRKQGVPRFPGREPEFCRMSNGGGRSKLGGLGAPAVPAVAVALNSRAGAAKVSAEGDVPSVVRWSKRMRPLGRYLRSRLRKEMGMAPTMPAAAKSALSLRMQAELGVPGARQRRELSREASAHRAEKLNQISISKKGSGI